MTLELGGKSPTILLDDVDLAQAIPLMIQAGFMKRNSGRRRAWRETPFWYRKSRKAEIETALAQAVAAVKSVTCRDSAIDVGLMVAGSSGCRCRGIFVRGSMGAHGTGRRRRRPADTGDSWFVRLTLFADVNNGMVIAATRFFGPVLCIIPYQDEAEAISIAMTPSTSLSAMVLGGDVDHARRVAQQIVSGACW